jgi:uncharacterized protein (DUF927 family)
MQALQETLQQININKIPLEMKERKQWVLWKQDSKKGKIPYSTNGIRASSTNPETWNSFEEILQKYRNGGYDGIGYMFHENDPFTGVDLDDCIIDRKMSEEAKSTIIALNSYTELSPSGTGAHVIVKGEVPGERNRKGKYEMYDSKRFFTVTGRHIKRTPLTIEERQQELNSLYERIFNDVEEYQEEHQEEQTSPPMTDDEIIEKALKAGNGERFKQLYYEGDISVYNNDHSTADLALCNMLAFYTQNAEQIDRLFRNSGLMRLKWNRKDYRDGTISKAIRETKSRYKVFENERPEDVFSKVSIPQDSNNQHDFNVPAQFEAVGDTLFQTVKRGKEFHEEMVLRALPFIEAELVNMERSQTLYRIGWTSLNSGRRITREVVPASSIATRRELLQLSDKGLPVNDNNAKSVITYFDQFLTVNEVDQVKAVERLGHVENKFISPLHESAIEIITLDQGEKQMLEAFETKGSSKEWIDNVFNPIKDSPVAAFVIASSFTSVILRDLNMSPFIVDLSGTTSTGKSTISKIAGSVWGNRNYVSEWNLTQVGLERKAAFLNSFPLILDDTRKANEWVLNDVIYHFSGGRGKGRGSVKGSQREMTWNNILISNGEIPLNDYARDKGGVSARNISFNDRPIQNADYKLFNTIYENIEQFYGAIGKEFLDVWNSHKKELLEEFPKYKKHFNKKAGSNEVLARLSNSFASVYFTSTILRNYLSMDIDLKAIEKLMNTLKENENLDKPLQMLEELLDHIDGSQDLISKEELKYFYKKDIDQLYLYPSFIKNMLGVESNQIRREWLNRGIALPDKEGNGTHPIWHANKTRKAVAINMEYVKKLGFDFTEIDEAETNEAKEDFL